MKILDKEQFKTAIKSGTLVVSATLFSTATWAATTADKYKVTEVVEEIGKGVAPVAAVASASISLLVVRRVWKIIRGSI